MNNQQYLIGKLAEECSEIIKECMKIQQFGMDSEYLGYTNKERLVAELKDLEIMKILLQDAGIIPEIVVSDNDITGRKTKMEFYHDLSQELGMIDK